MTSKDVASLSASLLRRGTRDKSHGFVLGRTPPATEKVPPQADSPAVPSFGATVESKQEPGSRDRTSADSYGGADAQRSAVVPGDGVSESGGNREAAGPDPLADMVRGVVQRYNQAFPFDPFFATPLTDRTTQPTPGQGRGQDRPMAQVDRRMPPAGSHEGPAPRLEAASGDGGENSVGDPLDGSLGALARRIEAIVQRTVEGTTAPAARVSPQNDRPTGSRASPEDETSAAVQEGERHGSGEPVVGTEPEGARAEGPARQEGSDSILGAKGAAVARVGTVSESSAPLDPKPAGAPDSASPSSLVHGDLALAQQVIEALRRGERAKADELFGALTGLTAGEVDRMLSEPDGEVLAAACRSLGMEQLQFVSLLLMTRKASSPMETVHAADLKQILEVFAEMSMDRAQELLRAWRLGTGS